MPKPKSSIRQKPYKVQEDIETRVNDIVLNVLAEYITPEMAVRLLLNEIGRGGRILVIDENIVGLEHELAFMNYTVYTVVLGESDEEIKKRLRGRVLITQNGKDFADDIFKHRYGLIWVRQVPDFKILAERVRDVLMKRNFCLNLTQVARI
jgi:hypothetical protein